MNNDTTPALSIIVPVYNEEDSLRPLYDELTRSLTRLDLPYEIILIDDGSSDRSFDVCSELWKADPDHVRAVRLRRNFGQTAALAAGFDCARGPVVVPMDADLQNDPADIALLLAKLKEGFDVVSGWRKDRKDRLLSRRLPSILANRLISRLTGVRLHDYGCTLKAYRREVIQHVNLYGEMHRFLPALASWAGANVTELPVNHRPRQFGQSKYGLSRTVRVILDLITVKFFLDYMTKPMQIFGLWGFAMIAGGVASAALTIALKVLPPHQDVTGNPWMYLGIFLLLGGLQLLGIGLLGEINVRTYYESQRKSVYVIREILDRHSPAPSGKTQ